MVYTPPRPPKTSDATKVKPTGLASIADDGRILILDGDGFAASRVNGEWVKGIQFSADAMKDDFSRIPPVEAAALIRAVKAVLAWKDPGAEFDKSG